MELQITFYSSKIISLALHSQAQLVDLEQMLPKANKIVSWLQFYLYFSVVGPGQYDTSKNFDLSMDNKNNAE